MNQKCRGDLLIVEDNELFRSLLRGVIHERMPQVEIWEAATLEEARRILRAHALGMVILDIRLPDGTGLDLAEQLHREQPQVSVALCTADDAPEYRERALQSGATHFFCKHQLDWDEVGRVTAGVFCRGRELLADGGPSAGGTGLA